MDRLQNYKTQSAEDEIKYTKKAEERRPDTDDIQSVINRTSVSGQMAFFLDKRINDTAIEQR